MATPSEFIGLIKPDETEQHLVSQVMNDNYLKIDNQVGILGSDKPFDTTWAQIKAPTNVTMASGWTMVNSTNTRVRRWGPYGYIRFQASRNSVISVPASGDVGNASMGTMAAPYRPALVSPLIGLGTGRVVFGYLETDGQVVFTASHPGPGTPTDIPAGQTIDLAGFYLLA